MTQPHESANANARELVAFTVGDQEYCVDIMAVREIRGWTPATAVPHAPDYVRGVINLRGVVLPIVDLATRLGLEPPTPTQRHVIIVSQAGEHIVGFLVDAVSDIVTILNEEIQPTPDVASNAAKAFVKGLLTVEGRMIRYMDLKNMLPSAQEAAA